MKTRQFYIAFVIFISLIPLVDLLKPGMYISHDFGEHAARLASFYQSLSQGNIIPRWAGNLNHGYGHPVFMFLYPLTNYLGSLIHFLGFSIVDSIKILFAASYIFSGLFMYLWIEKLWGSKAGLAAAILYLFAPYRFVDLYVRASLGEHLAFLFVPLLCWFITLLAKNGKKKFSILTGISLALLILSHNALSLVFLPLIFIYSIYLILTSTKDKKSLIISLLISLLLGFALSAFFWIPAFFEGKYTLREIVTNKEIFFSNYINWKELFVSKWGWGLSALNGSLSGFSVALGWTQILVFLLSIIFVLKSKKPERYFIILIILYFLFSAFLTTSSSMPIAGYIPFLTSFQFPWRLLAVPVFCASVLGSFCVKSVKVKLQTALAFGILIFAVLSNSSFWHIKGISGQFPDSFWINSYKGTTETGESTPRWAIRFQEKDPVAKVQAVQGIIDSIEINNWQFENHQYVVETKENTRVADNTLYFPGWKVFVNGKDVPIEFQDENWRGIITYDVPAGTSNIVIQFTDTKIRKMANIISFGAIIFVLIWYLIILLKNEKK